MRMSEHKDHRFAGDYRSISLDLPYNYIRRTSDQAIERALLKAPAGRVAPSDVLKESEPNIGLVEFLHVRPPFLFHLALRLSHPCAPRQRHLLTTAMTGGRLSVY